MTAWQRLPGSGRRVKLSGSIHRANEQLDFLQDVLSNFNGSFWPSPAVQASIAGCQRKNPTVATTGRKRPKAVFALVAC
jgi:hypothetical protein